MLRNDCFRSPKSDRRPIFCDFCLRMVSRPPEGQPICPEIVARPGLERKTVRSGQPLGIRIE